MTRITVQVMVSVPFKYILILANSRMQPFAEEQLLRNNPHFK